MKKNKNKFLIVLSFVFVLIVAFFAAKWMIGSKKGVSHRPAAIHKTVKKKPASKHAPKRTATAAKVAAPSSEGGKIAIILDDWGPNRALLDEAIAIGRPLTLAVIPHLPHSRDIAETAKANGLGVMLHMPMEPKGTRQPKEPYTIKTTSSESEIVRYLEEALASVPYAEGVNNHQGSAATSDARVMRAVLSHLKKKQFFFVDSRVIASSVAAKVAREVGIRFEERDVFIDNQPVVDAVMTQLREAQRIALTHGRAVVIGHDKRATLEAIKRMVPEFDKNKVRLVLVKEIVK